MGNRRGWKNGLAVVGICLIAFAAFATGRWWFPEERVHRPGVEGEKQVSAPTCRIEFLSPVERIARMNAPVELPLPVRFQPHGPVRPPHTVPLEQVDNPILLKDHFARVRFENTTGRPLVLYMARWVGDLGYEPLMENTAVVDVELRDPAGRIVEQGPHYWMSLAPPQVPSASVLRNNNHPLFVLQPGGHIDYPMSILGLATPKPMTYTVRAVVSYAEGPSGETKRVTSEPVAVTVTAEHIRATETYWKAR